jgi:hypothetical protein
MDPDANLEEQLDLAQQLLGETGPSLDDAQRLAELVVALDLWIRSGGFLPAAWRRQT